MTTTTSTLRRGSDLRSNNAMVKARCREARNKTRSLGRAWSQVSMEEAEGEQAQASRQHGRLNLVETQAVSHKMRSVETCPMPQT